eukprot:scaffold322_cov363-Pavlova_lutheri.AAC.2
MEIASRPSYQQGVLPPPCASLLVDNKRDLCEIRRESRGLFSLLFLFTRSPNQDPKNQRFKVRGQRFLLLRLGGTP